MESDVKPTEPSQSAAGEYLINLYVTNCGVRVFILKTTKDN